MAYVPYGSLQHDAEVVVLVVVILCRDEAYGPSSDLSGIERMPVMVMMMMMVTMMTMTVVDDASSRMYDLVNVSMPNLMIHPPYHN